MTVSDENGVQLGHLECVAVRFCLDYIDIEELSEDLFGTLDIDEHAFVNTVMDVRFKLDDYFGFIDERIEDLINDTDESDGST